MELFYDLQRTSDEGVGGDCVEIEMHALEFSLRVSSYAVTILCSK